MVPRVVGRRRISFDMLMDMMVKDTAMEREDMQTTMNKLAEALVFYLRDDEVTSVVVKADGVRVNFRPARMVLEGLQRGTSIALVESSGPAVPSISTLSNVEVPGT